MRTSAIARFTATLLLAAACHDPPARDPVGEVAGDAGGDEGAGTLDGRSFERSLVLVATPGDTLLALPWLVTAAARRGGVERTVRAYVLRGSEWDAVVRESWEDPPTRAPWRILPHGGLRVVVGMDDALERLVYEEGPLRLALAPEAVINQWTGPRGGTYRLLRGSAELGEQSVEGWLLDVSRSAAADETPHGGWALLVSGDSLQVVLHHPRRAVAGTGRWQGWARLDFRELRWPELALGWTETRAFERARRDVPVAWRVASAGEEVEGELRTEGAHLEALAGEGPQLPVSGLFAVHGTLTVEGRAYPVAGILHHVEG